MNIIELQERLKDLPEQALMQEMQMPSGTAPQFLVLSELKRRKRMRDEYQRQQAQGMQTVAEEAVTGAGAPAEGIMQMSRAMAPQSAIAQNTGVNDMMQQESVRAPQPEQPMMMARGGYVRRMQDGGFTGNQQQGYLIFLQSMGLADSPEAQQMYMRMMARQKERGVSPETFMPEMTRAPQGMSLANVSADVGAFLPGASAAPSMMGMPPAMMEPSVGTVDFDASVAAVPAAPSPRDPESYLDTMRRITGEATDVARGMGIPIPESQPGINIDDIVSPGDLEFGTPPAPSEGRDSSPILPQRLRDAIDTYRSTPSVNLNDIQGVGDLEYGGVQDVTSGESDLSLERLMRDLGFGPAMEKVAQTQQAAEARQAAAAEARAAEAARMMDINEIPATGRRVTDAGELIAPTSPAPVADSTKGAGGAGGAGGGAGGGDYGPIESRIARMLEERERSAQADKWLSLAQTGLALMASDQPTLGGAIGEAGLAGIGAMQKARSQYDKDIMELLDMQAGVQRARAAAARSARTGGLTASNLISRINSLEGDQRQLLVAINNAKNDPNLALSGTSADVSSLEQMFLGNQLELQQLRGQLNRLGGDAGVTSEQDFDATAS